MGTINLTNPSINQFKDISNYINLIQNHIPDVHELISSLNRGKIPEHFEDIILLGQGSEGFVITMGTDSHFCLKSFYQDVKSEQREIIISLPQSSYLATTYYIDDCHRLMEKVEGITLHDYLNQYPVIPSSLSDKLKGLVDFVLSLVTRGIYLNDLSVFNIMIRNDDSLVIVDYDNCSKDYFQLPPFLSYSGLTHLTKYLFDSISTLQISKDIFVTYDLDRDYDDNHGQENWLNKLEEKFSLRSIVEETTIESFYTREIF